MSAAVDDFDALFDEDYLYFYGPMLEKVSDADTGRSTTERLLVRGGRTRRFRYSVRMFIAVELADWLRDAGFARVEFRGRDGQALTAQSKRMIAIAWR